MFPGDVDAYLENLDERREHDKRLNAATLMAKRKQLEQFIASNRANANTASQARSKAKQLEKLELVEVAGDEARVHFSFPAGRAAARDPRCGTENLAIGYDGPHRGRRHPRGDRARRPGRRGRRQRPGQDDLPAHDLRVAPREGRPA